MNFIFVSIRRIPVFHFQCLPCNLVVSPYHEINSTPRVSIHNCYQTKNILAINVNHWMINEDALYVSTPISSLPSVLHLLIRFRYLATWGGQRKMFIFLCPRVIFKWFAGSKTIYPLYVRHLLIASFAFHNLLIYLR